MSSLIRTEPSGICSTSTGRPTAAVAAPRPPGALDLPGREAVQERVVVRHSACVRAGHHDAIAARNRSVPRSTLRDDHRVLVAGGEHRARVEGEAERRHVRAELLYRRLGRRAGPLRTELRI